MPTPIAPIIDAASTLADSFIATGVVYDYLGLFAAFAVGLAVAVRLFRLVRRSMGR